MNGLPFTLAHGLRLAWGLAALSLAAGCMHPPRTDSARIGPFFSPGNVASEANLGGIRRVVVLPLASRPDLPKESIAALDEVFVAALVAEKRFEVVTLSREECRRRFGVESLLSTDALPHDLMATLQREFEAEGVLFVDMTTYHAYKPISMGLRAKLARAEDARLVWSFDNLFSAEDPLLQNSARRHFLDRDRSIPADLTVGVLLSPRQFATYAAAAMFGTLPHPLVAAHVK
jgi:hypothetical protein